MAAIMQDFVFCKRLCNLSLTYINKCVSPLLHSTKRYASTSLSFPQFRIVSHVQSPWKNKAPVFFRPLPMNMQIVWKNYHSMSCSINQSSLNRQQVRLMSKQHGHDPIGPVRLTKVVHTGDTQFLNMLQGGLLLELLEASSDVAATKHCNRYAIQKQTDNKSFSYGTVPALAGVEKVEFIGTAKVGDLLEIISEVVHAGEKSLKVSVSAYCRNQKEHRLMARAWMWYVPLSDEHGTTSKLVDVQHFKKVQLSEAEQLIEASYLARIKTRNDASRVENLEKLSSHLLTYARHKFTELPMTTSLIVQQSHCGKHGICKAGPMLRLIDELSGCLAVGVIKGFCVTGSLDNITFISPVPCGSCITYVARPVFSSQKSMDFQVIGCIDNPDGTHQVFAEAFATFVLVGKHKEEIVIPSLSMKTDEQRQLFEERNKLYLQRKSMATKSKKIDK